MNTLEITLGGEKHQLNWEITQDGEFEWWATREMKLRGQPVEIQIERMEQVFTNRRLTAINTYYAMYALDNEGNKIDASGNNPNYCVRFPMTANTPDRKGFVLGFAAMLNPSMWNGYVRSGLQFNYIPPFNSLTGQVQTYTAEQQAAPPSGDYYTHHADGTPINPTADENTVSA